VTTPTTNTVLSPELLSRLSALRLKAKTVVDGVLSGLHRSPHHGSSVEFAEHKEYAPGDEIRHIDWRAFAKSDKYYVRRFERETNLRAMILLDASSSMQYKSTAATASKWEFAQELCAALSYLLLRQQDAVGLTVIDQEVQQYIPPRSHSNHLVNVCETLVSCTPKPHVGTQLVVGTNQLLEVFNQRGLVFVVSDFMDNDSRYFTALRQLRSRKQKVHLLQVLDPWEIDFPFSEMTLFRSLETGQNVLAEPRFMRETYLRELRRFIDELRQNCLESGFEYRRFNTQMDLTVALTKMIAGSSQSDGGVEHGI